MATDHRVMRTEITNVEQCYVIYSNFTLKHRGAQAVGI